MNQFHYSNQATQIKLNQSKIGAQLLTIDSEAFKDLLFLSDIQVDEKSYRGGVPVLFPQFNNVGNYKKHGYVRDLDWKIDRQVTDCSDNETLKNHTLQTIATLELNPNNTNNEWSHTAKLTLTTTITENLLKMDFTIKNTGDTDFEFTGGLHPYFYIHKNSVHTDKKIDIEGLDGIAFERYAKDLHDDNKIIFDGRHIERLYEKAPDVRFFNGESMFKISCKGFDQWMVWNCGAEGAKNLQDLPDEQWRNFICIESVSVSSPIKLSVGESFVGSMVVEKLA